MKNILILILFPLISFGQTIKRTENGYSNVYTTDKTTEQVYSKAKEWIALNFKSANDVIQLDTSDKIIIKGLLPFSINSAGIKIDYIGDITLTIAIREGRYKVDVDFIGQFSSVAYPSIKLDWATVGATKIFNKEELLSFTINSFNNSPYPLTKRQKEKAIKEAVKNNDAAYSAYLANTKSFDNTIESLFSSINDGINTIEEDW